MPIPGQQLILRDPGLGLVAEAATAPLVLGCSSAGIVNTLYAFSNKGQVIDTLGQGRLPEMLCHKLDMGGGPVYGMRLTGSTAGAAGAVTADPVGSATGTVTVAGAAFDAYEVIVEIVTTGTLGTGRFKYSLDDGYTYSEEITIPSGATYVLPDTNLTLTFVPGAGAVFFEDGDAHSFDCTAPLYSTSDLAAGFTALLAGTTEFTYVTLTGKHASASAAATMFASFDTHLTSLSTQLRYVRGIMDGGDDSAASWISAFAAVADARIAVCFGDADMASSKAHAGWGTPKMPSYVPVAGRCHGLNGTPLLISTDPARFADGPLSGVVAISHDEAKTELLDQHKATTLRTWQGSAGFYITNVRLKSPTGSDFKYWQHGRVMDVACDTTVKAERPFINTSVRVNADGSILETDALSAEETVKNSLRARLVSPNNAEGTPGHVSDFGYKINRTHDLLGTEEQRSTVAIRPLGYRKHLIVEIGYARNVSLGA